MNDSLISLIKFLYEKYHPNTERSNILLIVFLTEEAAGILDGASLQGAGLGSHSHPHGMSTLDRPPLQFGSHIA